LDLVRAITQAGLPCQVLVAPVLPMITDSDADLDRLLGRVAEAGARSATVMALHLRTGAREWFLRYLSREYPHLVGPYAELYRGSAYVVRSYAQDLARRVRPLLTKHGLDRPTSWRIPRPEAAAKTGPPIEGPVAPALF
jgi:DNA repair photolyase